MGHIDDLASSQRAIARQAEAQLRKFWAMYGRLPAGELRDALLTFMPALTERYGDLAAVAAADWYDKTKAETVGGKLNAKLASIEREAVVQSTRWAVDDLYHGNPLDTWRKLESSLLRRVRNAGRETVRLSSERDGVAYARVPSGAKTCAFCTLMASRGFTYGSKEAAGDTGRSIGDGFHDDCDCKVLPEFAMTPAERIAHSKQVNEASHLYEAARNEVEADGNVPTVNSVAQRMRDMNPHGLTDGAEVPSVLREKYSGWPENVKPVPGRTWRHILKRHGPNGTAHDLFDSGMSEYDIAKIIRDVVANPDYTAPHPKQPGTTLNFFKTIDGTKYVVGTYLDGNGRLSIATAFPPGLN